MGEFYPAVRRPLLPKDSFELACKLSGVADGTGEKCGAKPSANVGEVFEIAGERFRTFDESIRRERDIVVATESMEQTHAHARRVRMARKGDQRYAHEERLACGGRAMVRKSIERDVHFAVTREMTMTSGLPTHELYAIGRDAMRFKHAEVVSPSFGITITCRFEKHS